MRRDRMARDGGEGPAMPVCAAMDRTPVIAALEGGVLTLMLNRPQRLNAMSHGLIEAMNHELGARPRR